MLSTISLVLGLQSLQDATEVAQLQKELYSYYYRYEMIREYESMHSLSSDYCRSKGPIYIAYELIFEIDKSGLVSDLFVISGESLTNCILVQYQKMKFTPPPVSPFYVHVRFR